MRRTFVSVVFALTTIVSATAYGDDTSRVPAFPGADGYGKFSLGGRGGDVYHVTNVDDTGPGSLRYGVAHADGPRTIVFDIGGTISLKSMLRIEKNRLTIAGQTAPGDGITIRGQNFSIRKASDVVVRYIRFRLGDKNKEIGGADTLTIDYANNVMLDHLSSSWGIDGNQDERGCTNYTMQWCILGEALNDSIHPKGAHAMCGSFRQPMSNMTIHHNLFATSRERHPTLGGGDPSHPEFVIDFRNNVDYNWSGAANVCDNQVNLIGNYFRPGPETHVDQLPIDMKANLPDKAHGYMEGNIFEKRDDLTKDNYAALDLKRWIRPDTNYKYAGTIKDWKVAKAFDVGDFAPKTTSAKQAFDDVLAHAGASLKRDTVDVRLIHDVRDHKGKLLNSQDEVGGWPNLAPGTAPLDTDQDGMPDAWETAHHLDPKNPDDRNVVNKNGYTNLEEYLASLCK